MPSYDGDIHAWAAEQARLLRAGRFDLVDVDNIAAEIEDVGKSERRELASRLTVLLAHLLKWQYQPARQNASSRRTVTAQRNEIVYLLKESPSLAARLHDAAWLQLAWDHAVARAVGETGLDYFPAACPWSIDGEVLADGWLPTPTA